MTMRCGWRGMALLAVAVLVLLPTVALAQAPGSFAGLARDVQPGAFVVVVSRNGDTLHGLVKSVSPSSLVLTLPRDEPGGLRTWAGGVDNERTVEAETVAEVWRASGLGRRERRIYTAPGVLLGTERLQTGDTVIVTDPSGRRLRGQVKAFSPTSLAVSVEGDVRTLMPADIYEIKRPGPIWDGAVKGALIGGGIAGLIGASYGVGGQAFSAGALWGAGIGLGVDAAFGPKRIYRMQPPSRNVTVSPLFGRGGAGARVSVSF